MTPAPTRRGFLALAAVAATAAPAPVPGAPPAMIAPTPARAAPVQWLPADYQDDIIYRTCDDPAEWLIPRGSGHVLADEHGEEPHDDAPPLADGDVLAFDCITQHGTGTLTVHHMPDDADRHWRPWTIDPPMPRAPAGSTMHICHDTDRELCGVDLGEIADELPPGTYTVAFYAWGSRRFRYSAAAGTLIPEPAAETRHGR